jgi:tRNA-2-methylthio-N6-dimethylallyladenosine synthase
VMASPDIIGKVLPVSIESLERYSLLGTLVPSNLAPSTLAPSTLAPSTLAPTAPARPAASPPLHTGA